MAYFVDQPNVVFPGQEGLGVGDQVDLSAYSGDRIQELLESGTVREGEAPDEPEDPAKSDGWPDGYTWERHGAYYEVYDPDGEKVASDTASGNWQGENAAQEAAWNDAGG